MPLPRKIAKFYPLVYIINLIIKPFFNKLEEKNNMVIEKYLITFIPTFSH